MVGVYYNLVIVFISNGGSPPAYTVAGSYAGNTRAWNCLHADLDSDGVADIVTVGVDSQTVSVFMNDGAVMPTLTLYSLALGEPSFGIDVGDLNDDGVPDIAATGLSHTLWFQGNGAHSPNFTRHTVVNVGGPFGSSIAIADANLDGYMDIVTSWPDTGLVAFFSDGATQPQWTQVLLSSTLTSTSLLAIPRGTDLGTAPGLELWVMNANGDALLRFATTDGVTYSEVVVGHWGFRSTAADVNGDGAVDALASTYQQTYLYLSSGTEPPTFSWPYLVINDATLAWNAAPQHIQAGDADNDGDLDVAISDWNNNSIMWYENTVCRRGYASPTGSEPCAPCNPGQYSSFIGSTQCVQCPIGRYSSSVAAWSCSGACVAPIGYVCPLGATSSIGVPCPPGSYNDGATGATTSCLLCPAGRYGATTGVASAGCTGPCNAVPGSGCDSGVTSPQGRVCPQGFYSPGGSGPCMLCPAGVYGSSMGLNSAACSGVCTAFLGSYCLPGAITPMFGVPCPTGQYSTGGPGVSSCSLCAPGLLGSSQGMSNASCAGACPIGQYNAQPGTAVCSPCPAGRFGATPGLNTPLCSGPCAANSPGQYCPPGATAASTPCPAGQFSNGTDASESQCTPCDAGRFGSVGDTASSCTGACAAGYFSSVGSSSCTPCPAGRYSDRGAGACVDCPASTFSSTEGATSPACEGNCVATPGTYCPVGATSSQPQQCLPGQYSLTGSYGQCSTLCTAMPRAGYYCPGSPNATTAPSPLPCPVGTYSASANQTACTKCAIGT